MKGKERRLDGDKRCGTKCIRYHALSAKHTPYAAPAFDPSQTITTRTKKNVRLKLKQSKSTLLFGPCILFASLRLVPVF